MEKSTVPTSRYQLFCDTFDTKLEVRIHEVGRIEKVLISIQSEDGKEEKSISIYREEVAILAAFLDSVMDYVDKRP